MLDGKRKQRDKYPPHLSPEESQRVLEQMRDSEAKFWDSSLLDDAYRLHPEWAGLPIRDKPRIGDDVNRHYRSGSTWRPRDPLAIDLDGDGIEVLGANAQPVLFDHNADGLKTGTGWLKGDDAWVVMDRDGNGTIDSGRELFGVDTLITDRKTVTNPDGSTSVVTFERNATSGFEALRAQDSNNDGVLDAKDAAFAQVRLWRDLNSDGISQAGELSTLEANGIVSIGLVANNTTKDLGGGNSITGKATVTRLTGGSTEMDSVMVGGESAANLNLTDNPFYREFTDKIPLTDLAKTLPEIKGSGELRDLREAMSLDTAQGRRLAELVQKFGAAATQAERLKLTEQILSAWADTGKTDFVSPLAGNMVRTIDMAVGTPAERKATFLALCGDAMDAKVPGWRSLLDGAAFEQQRIGGVGTVLDVGTDALFAAAISAGVLLSKKGPAGDAWYGVPGAGRNALDTELNQLTVLESFNGAAFPLWNVFFRATPPGTLGAQYERVSGNAQVSNLLYEAYGSLRDSVYTALATQTYLQKYPDLVSLDISDAGVAFKFDALNAEIDKLWASNKREAAALILDLNRAYGSQLTNLGWDAKGRLEQVYLNAAEDGEVRAALAASSQAILRANNAAATAGADLYVAAESALNVSAGAGNDLLMGGVAADSLSGDSGNDILIGGRGDDALTGSDGDDTLVGGIGNDTLDGGLGNDTFLFSAGFGQDVLNQNDNGSSRLDVVKFTDLASTDVQSFERVGSNLVLSFKNGDRLTLTNYYYSDGWWEYKINQIQFTDMSWDQATIKAKTVTQGTTGNDSIAGYDGGPNVTNGLAGNDTITGGNQADWLDGGEGNDSLTGNAGNDTLLGGEGNNALDGGDGNDVLTSGSGADVLLGGAGNDTLTAGAGNDTLDGGLGNDTFLFSAGFGQDVLNQNDNGSSRLDVVKFTDLASTDVQILERVGLNLVLSFKNGDRLTLTNYYYSDGWREYKINQIQFTDMSWDQAAIKAKTVALVAGTSANDALTAIAGMPNRLLGDAGNDSLTGGSGNDSLDGGTGDDVLTGGAGGDTYLFGKDYGADRIVENDATAGVVDRVQLGAGLTAADLKFTRSGNNLVAAVNGTTDTLTLQDWYLGSAYQVEEFRFSNGDVLTNSQVQSLVSAMAGFSSGAALSFEGEKPALHQQPHLGVSALM